VALFTHYIAFTAGSNGSYIKEARIKAATTNGTTAVSATSIRFYISTVASGAVSGADTHFITEVAIPAFTPAAATASPDFIVPLNFALESGKYLLCNTGVVAAGQHVLQSDRFRRRLLSHARLQSPTAVQLSD
jgi:hypothetical protein